MSIEGWRVTVSAVGETRSLVHHFFDYTAAQSATILMLHSDWSAAGHVTLWREDVAGIAAGLVGTRRAVRKHRVAEKTALCLEVR